MHYISVGQYNVHFIKNIKIREPYVAVLIHFLSRKPVGIGRGACSPRPKENVFQRPNSQHIGMRGPGFLLMPVIIHLAYSNSKYKHVQY